MDTLCASGDGAEAGFECLECHATWCDDCLERVAAHPHMRKCPRCGNLARPRADNSRREAGLSAELVKALGEPFRSPAVWAWLASSAFMCASFAFFHMHWLAWAGTTTLVLGYHAAYGSSVLERTVDATAEPFGGDIVHDLFGLVIMPIGRTYALAAAFLGPAAWLAAKGHHAVAAAVCALGALWFPMAWMRATLQTQLSSGFAPSVLSSIARTAPSYVPVALLLSVAFVVPLAARALSDSLVAVVAAPLLSYAAILAPRALGHFYFHRQDDLDWFSVE